MSGRERLINRSFQANVEKPDNSYFPGRLRLRANPEAGGFDAALDAKLGERSTKIVPDSTFAQPHIRAYLLVTAAEGKKFHASLLLDGEKGESIFRVFFGSLHGVKDAACDLRIENRTAACNGQNHRRYIRSRRVLEKVTIRAR